MKVTNVIKHSLGMNDGKNKEYGKRHWHPSSFKWLFTMLLLSAFSCNAQNSETLTYNDEIIVGASRLDQYLPILKDKKIAVLANHSSLIGETHLIDSLLSLDISIVKVFAPEHGFRGNKSDGATINDSKDEKTGLPIVSIYGKNKYLPKEHLSDVDILLFDIQDVGVRFYTFISAMHYAMKACAESNTAFMVLDRPNPNGMYVDGPVLDSALSSYVGVHPIPVVHGLTVGELAHMINGEGWLGEKQCELTVITTLNYSHDLEYSLPVKPSPNLPNDQSIKLYPSLALFEGTEISVGRGTYKPFLQIGHPAFTDLSYSFTPASIDGMSKYPPLEGKTCYGYNLEEIDFKPQFTLNYLLEFYERFPKEQPFFKDYFHKLIGNTETMEQIKSGMSEEEIRETWKADLDNYKLTRKKYLLYPDFE